MILHNAGSAPFVVRRGDRVAQLVVSPVASVAWREVELLDATARGDGGFGHTGRRRETAARRARSGRTSPSQGRS